MIHSSRLANAAQPQVATRRDALAGGCFRLKLFLLALALQFSPGTAPLHSQVATNLYTFEHERSPQVDQFYSERFRQRAREQQEKFRKRIPIRDAVGDNVPTLATVNSTTENSSAPEPAPALRLRPWLILGLVILGGLLGMRWLFPATTEQILHLFSPGNAPTANALADAENVRAEGQAFAEFVAAFRTGPATPADATMSRPPLQEFMVRWPRILADLRKQLQEARQASEPRTRRRLLYDLGREFRSLKGETGMPELLPVWQMACALEGLLKQLGDKVNEVTASTWRTVAGGVDLLAELCQPGLDAHLLTRRPVRLLAVDDDPISRHAISFALKRTLHAPDLANDGETGLARAREHAYDVIFLDVEMPHMDGFEVCTKIHKAAPNRNTPVVFVTSQNDFNARAQSTLSGGCDLIAKPFLTFELAVKALTLALQHRQREGKLTERPEPVSAVAPREVVAPAVVGGKLVIAPASDEEVSGFPPSMTRAGDAPGVVLSGGEPSPGWTGDSAEIATEFLTHASEHLDWVRDTLRSALKLADATVWQQTLAEVYLRLHAFTPDAKFTTEHPAMQLSSALEGLLRRQFQNSTPPTRNTMVTVGAGVELLCELCGPDAAAAQPGSPIQMLVVDDDPIARRALTGAVQTAFAKPANAADGAAALALTAEQVFDVIFLDVQMPGMDGFEVCARIRQAGANRQTPVIFVSGGNDPMTVAEARACGGSDWVVKPVFPAELLVKVLTLVLRRRRDRPLETQLQPA